MHLLKVWRRPVVLYTDACWEVGFCGVGAVLVDGKPLLAGHLELPKA